jgi:hypothetical protein
MVEQVCFPHSLSKHTGRRLLSGFTRLVVELADLPGHPARVIARQHKAQLEYHLAEQLAVAGIARSRESAREIWLLAEGAIFAWRS